MNTNEKLSLAELQLIIKDSLYLAMPGLYWVIAEISEIKENYSGHCYLELVEKHPHENSISARVRGVIWSSRYRLLKTIFENSTGESLREGIKILVRVRIEYHEIYGLSLVISDIDPSFTLGEMAQRRQQILKRLEEDGVLEMNREIVFPVVPQRIAIISSKNAAGYSDFMKHLSENSYGYTFYTALFETPMQGVETELGVISSLERIAGIFEMFDVVVIIRGGGSQTDLSWFDNYKIAYFITQFPLPVLTGIGHEKDLSVTDIVAYKSLKTPTAVADFLIECMNMAENMLANISLRIREGSASTLDSGKQHLESHRVRLIPLARMMISEIKEELSAQIIELINIGKEFIVRAGINPANQRSRLITGVRSFLAQKDSTIKKEKESLYVQSSNLLITRKLKLERLEASQKLLDPDNVLRRGYTITSLNGKIIKSASLLNSEDLISTKFSDGVVKSKVTGSKLND